MRYILSVIFILALGVGALFLSQSSSPATPSLTPTSNTSQNDLQTNVSKDQASGVSLQLPAGFDINNFAQNLGQARDLQFSPGGTLLVSVPSSNQIIALPDKNDDGVADTNKVIIKGENHPHGLAFYNNKLYVANVDQVVRFNWDESTLTATKDKVLFSLPQNSNHNNRTLNFDSTGKMYVSVGSTCNVCNESSNFSATVLISDAEGKSPTVFASGLRNAPFTQVNPQTSDLWGTEMGRDNLGDDLPPDEINIIRQGQNYGWPKCYGNKVHDSNFDKSSANPCSSTESPIYSIPAHSAPLGLVFINSPQFPSDWQNDLLVAYHGSWNRSTPTGYKVVHLKVSGNTITSSEDFLTGFLPGTTASSSLGRPVDLTFDKSGNLYLSDDKAGKVYVIQKST